MEKDENLFNEDKDEFLYLSGHGCGQITKTEIRKIFKKYSRAVIYCDEKNGLITADAIRGSNYIDVIEEIFKLLRKDSK